jgi:hypothetical protein
MKKGLVLDLTAKDMFCPDLWFDRMVLVDGMARSGKSLIATALSNIESFEPWQLPVYVDHVVKYLEMSQFTLEGAQAALRIGLNSHAFDYAVGRGLNRRLSDQSNVERGESAAYLRAREDSNSYELLVKEFRQSFRIPVFVAHEQISFTSFWMDTVPNLHYLEACRHPATLMLSWSRRNLTERWGNDPLLFVPCPTGERGPYPIFAHSSKERWMDAQPEERLLLSLELQFKQLWAAVDALTSEQTLHFRLIPIEFFKEEPRACMESMLSWLGAGSIDDRFENFLQFEGLPRSEQLARGLSATRELIDIHPKDLHSRIRLLIEEYEDRVRSTGGLFI